MPGSEQEALCQRSLGLGLQHPHQQTYSAQAQMKCVHGLRKGMSFLKLQERFTQILKKDSLWLK